MCDNFCHMGEHFTAQMQGGCLKRSNRLYLHPILWTLLSSHHLPPASATLAFANITPLEADHQAGFTNIDFILSASISCFSYSGIRGYHSFPSRSRGRLTDIDVIISPSSCFSYSGIRGYHKVPDLPSHLNLNSRSNLSWLSNSSIKTSEHFHPSITLKNLVFVTRSQISTCDHAFPCPRHLACCWLRDYLCRRSAKGQ